jgi:dynein heavy chain
LWPSDALLAVSSHFLNDFPMDSTVEEKNSIIQLLGEIHDNVAKDCTSYFQRYVIKYKLSIDTQKLKSS